VAVAASASATLHCRPPLHGSLQFITRCKLSLPHPPHTQVLIPSCRRPTWYSTVIHGLLQLANTSSYEESMTNQSCYIRRPVEMKNVACRPLIPRSTLVRRVVHPKRPRDQNAVGWPTGIGHSYCGKGSVLTAVPYFRYGPATF